MNDTSLSLSLSLSLIYINKVNASVKGGVTRMWIKQMKVLSHGVVKEEARQGAMGQQGRNIQDLSVTIARPHNMHTTKLKL
mgnify:CR=1 FL=1